MSKTEFAKSVACFLRTFLNCVGIFVVLLVLWTFAALLFVFEIPWTAFSAAQRINEKKDVLK